jgi:hypothetical protein
MTAHRFRSVGRSLAGDAGVERGTAELGDADRLFRTPACHARGPVDNSLIFPWLLRHG